VFREGASLLRVGVVMAALALVLVVCAVVVSVALRTEPGKVLAADVAKKALGELSLGKLPWYPSGESASAQEKPPGEDGSSGYSFFGEEGSTHKKSGGDDPPRDSSSSGEESLGNGSSSHSEGTAGHKEAGEAQGVDAASEAESSGSNSAMSRPPGAPSPSEASSDPELQPHQDRPHPEDQVSAAGQRTAYGAFSEPGSPSQQDQTHSEDQVLPAGEGNDWPKPTPQEVRQASSARHYDMVPGAVMGLTIDAIGIHDAPVFDSDGYEALVQGIAHVPGTSWPWSPTSQRNVYLAGHRMGYRGTWSRMLFYNLDKLQKGDSVVLRDRSGRTYEYRVSEVLVAQPTDAWVMGQVRGRDMVSLQTCIPLYTFDKRLIVRADRV
jgi:sortase A